MTDLLVPPRWLADRLGQPGMSIVVGSWYLPAERLDARA